MKRRPGTPLAERDLQSQVTPPSPPSSPCHATPPPNRPPDLPAVALAPRREEVTPAAVAALWAWRLRGLSPRGGRPPWRPWKSWRRPSSPSSPSSGRRLSPVSRHRSRRRLTRYRRRLSPLSRHRSLNRRRRRFSPLSRHRSLNPRCRRLSRYRRRFNPLSPHRSRRRLSRYRRRRRLSRYRRRFNPLSRHRSRRRLSLYRRRLSRLSPLSRYRRRRLSRHRSLNRHRCPSTVSQEPLHRRCVILGDHQDFWVFGGTDLTSGTADL
ncbi:uncharacterized protein LOC141577846 [Camelus bactrianus]|uniref:Uncharacterized protein LOC141577846 n=1 Tax=Camelus bactrianus TaxID=9837 RepID=A0AC58QF64_CAMBA